jgi:transposase-like protein
MAVVVRKSKKRFANEQIVEFLRQAESGVPVRELCRQNGFSDTTFYRWRERLREARHTLANDKK